jgi:hypothetical protein
LAILGEMSTTESKFLEVNNSGVCSFGTESVDIDCEVFGSDVVVERQT